MVTPELTTPNVDLVGHHGKSRVRPGAAVAAARQAPSARRWIQVLAATALIAGCPVAVVWWLRASSLVTSPMLGVLLGVTVSVSISQLGRVVWERRPDSEDLLFSDLMLWGFLRRRRTQRQLASAVEVLWPSRDTENKSGTRALTAKQQAKLLERLVSGIETRDPYLDGHSRRVARHSWMIAKRLGLHPAEVARIRAAAALHDVGKIETPRAILHKPGALTDEEYGVIKRHPSDGARMVAALGDREMTAMVRHHHERLDGSGYPHALRGDDIPLGARIIAVADTFDAITSARPYRAASPHKRAIDILGEEAGVKLDAQVVRAFSSYYGGLRPIALWAFIVGLPERFFSSLSSGAGNVASAVKMMAVAAAVGGTAATTTAIALPLSREAPKGPPPITIAAHNSALRMVFVAAATHVRAEVHAQALVHGQALVHAQTVAHEAKTGASHASLDPARASSSGSSAAEGPSSANEPAGAAAPAAAASGQAVGEAHSIPSGGHGAEGNEHAHGKSEESHGSSQEIHGKNQEPHGQNEEVHGKSEEAHGKSEESHGKAEEPHGKSEETHGSSEEPHGKSEEAPVKSEEAHAKNEESHGKAEEAKVGSAEAHGKSEEAHAKSEGIVTQ